MGSNSGTKFQCSHLCVFRGKYTLLTESVCVLVSKMVLQVAVVGARGETQKLYSRLMKLGAKSWENNFSWNNNLSIVTKYNIYHLGILVSVSQIATGTMDEIVWIKTLCDHVFFKHQNIVLNHVRTFSKREILSYYRPSLRTTIVFCKRWANRCTYAQMMSTI